MAHDKTYAVSEKTKLEYSVNFNLSNESCVENLKKSCLQHPNITGCSVNLDTQSVVVESTLTTAEVTKLIEGSSGSQAVLTGMGSAQQKIDSANLGAAVCMVNEGNPALGIRGVIRMIQTSRQICVIDGTVDGLNPDTPHRVGIHEYGDISKGCASCGKIYSQIINSKVEHVGDLGRFQSDNAGRLSFRTENKFVKVWDVIGRSIVIQSKPERETNWFRLACGIIARSAGLFQNPKKICACDGVTIWEEKEVPISGESRNRKNKSQM